MTVLAWPADLVPKNVMFAPRGHHDEAGASLSGLHHAAYHSDGYWQAELGPVPLASPAAVKAFRRFSSRLRGGTALVRVPVFDGRQRPWPAGGAAARTQYTDGTDFTDGTRFAERTIKVETNGAHARGSTKLAVTVSSAGTISAGMRFTIGGALHEIVEVLDVSGADQSFWIRPRLRQAHADAAPVYFDAPTCLMRLARPGAADLDLSFGAWGVPALTFVEAFPE